MIWQKHFIIDRDGKALFIRIEQLAHDVRMGAVAANRVVGRGY